MKMLQYKLNRKSQWLWIASLSLVLLGFMAFFPSMANDAMKDLVDNKLNGLPDSIMNIVGLDSFPDFTDIKVFYGYILQYIEIATAIYAISLGLNSYLKEEKEGTIEYLYAQPFSRTDIIREKLCANIVSLLVILLIIICVSVLSIILFIPKGVNIYTVLTDTVPVFVSMIAISFVFLFIGFGFSLLLNKTVSITGLSMMVVFGSYIFGVMAALVKSLEGVKWISLFHSFNPSKVYAGDANIFSLLFWFGLSIGILLMGVYRFQKRNMQV